MFILAYSGVVFRAFVIVFCFVKGSRIWQLNCCVNNFILLYYLLNFINVRGKYLRSGEYRTIQGNHPPPT